MGDQDAGLKEPGFSVKVPEMADEIIALECKVDDFKAKLDVASKALDRIAWILATPEWSVGMLGDIAEIVVESGHEVEMHEEYVHH
jgi:hypothetical protein